MFKLCKDSYLRFKTALCTTVLPCSHLPSPNLGLPHNNWHESFLLQIVISEMSQVEHSKDVI